MNQSEKLGPIEAALGYVFKDRSLLEQALTHSSHAHEQQQLAGRLNFAADSRGHYERLEFLGDAILSLVVADLVMRKNLDADEGELSRIRSALVNTESLAELARELGLGPALRLGKGEEGSGGRDKPSILAAAYEAVLAAIYLDGGFEPAFDAVARQYQARIEGLSSLDLLGDYKSPLQEKVQARHKTTPTYRVVKEEGPDHLRMFEVELIVAGQPWARGRGRSKKEAEQDAARQALLSGRFDDEG